MMIDTIIKMIGKQIEEGELLIKNRPIARDSFENWEKATCKVLKKSAPIDPVAMNRFLGCGTYGDDPQKSDKAFREIQYAMSIYDKIRILDYHISMLKREKKYIN